MIKAIDCYYLREDVPIESLAEYGFRTLNRGYSYFKPYGDDLHFITVYSDSRRVVRKELGRTIAKAKKVAPFVREIESLIKIRKTAVYLNVNPFTRWQYFNDEKIDRIERKLKERQEALWKKKKG